MQQARLQVERAGHRRQGGATMVPVAEVDFTVGLQTNGLDHTPNGGAWPDRLIR